MIQGYCAWFHITCVVDFTSKTDCKSVEPRAHPKPEAALDWVAKQCPSYKWERQGNVYIVAPKSTSDSALTGLVGPVNDKSDRSAESLIALLFDQSGLPHPLGAGDTETSRSANPRVMRFKFPRMQFRKALIRAARQFGPSVWIVSVSNINPKYYSYFASDRPSQ
jgi:hypothetical protein